MHAILSVWAQLLIQSLKIYWQSTLYSIVQKCGVGSINVLHVFFLLFWQFVLNMSQKFLSNHTPGPKQYKHESVTDYCGCEGTQWQHWPKHWPRSKINLTGVIDNTATNQNLTRFQRQMNCWLKITITHLKIFEIECLSVTPECDHFWSHDDKLRHLYRWR